MIFSTPSSGGASGTASAAGCEPALRLRRPGGLLRRLHAGGVEVELGVLVLRPALALDHVQEADEAALHQLVADRAQAVRRRAHQPRRGDRLVQLLGQRAVLAQRARPHGLLPPGKLGQDLGCRRRRDAAEGRLQEAAHVAALRLARHQHQRAELDAVRVRLDLERLLRQLARGAREAQRLVARPVGARPLCGAHRPRVADGGVRVRERGVLDVAVDEALALLPVGDDLELDARAVLLVPLRERLVVGDHRLVLPRVELDLEHVGRLGLPDPARHADRLARGDLAVHRGRGDADALLAATLLEAVELRPVEQLAEDLRHLVLHDAGPVVLDDDQEAALALRELGRVAPGLEREVVDLDRQLGKDAGLLARVERVVDGFLDRGQQGLGRVVEAEQVAVLREELGDRDLALLLCQRLGGDALGPGGTRRREGAGAASGYGCGRGPAAGLTTRCALGGGQRDGGNPGGGPRQAGGRAIGEQIELWATRPGRRPGGGLCGARLRQRHSFRLRSSSPASSPASSRARASLLCAFGGRV